MNRTEDYLKRLATILDVQASGTESRALIDAGDRAATLETIRSRLNASRANVRLDSDLQEALKVGLKALKGLQNGELYEEQATNSRVGLEALVKLKGRPPLFVVNDQLDPDDPLKEEWHSLDFENEQEVVRNIAPSVGRIDLNGRHVGTGFVISDGLIMTNRHVAQAIAKEFKARQGRTWILKAGQVTIDFKCERDSADTHELPITGVVASGADYIGDEIDLKHLDAAILSVAGQTPKPLKFLPEFHKKYAMGTQIAAIGYPAKPALGQYSAVSILDVEVERALIKLFSCWWGVKRYSPGELLKAKYVIAKPSNWALSHDATTTGGSSGSPIFLRDAGSRPQVCGLHFAGMTLSANLAHGASAVAEALGGEANVPFGFI